MATLLRAGPFCTGPFIPPEGTANNSFANAPAEPSSVILPVNCAQDTQSFWPWRYYRRRFAYDEIGPDEIDIAVDEESYETGQSDNIALTGEEASFVEVEMGFAYQSNNSFNITGTADADSAAELDWVLYQSGTLLDSGSQLGGTLDLSTITFPATAASDGNVNAPAWFYIYVWSVQGGDAVSINFDAT